MDFSRTDGVNPGGADGCLDFEDPDNKGLEDCVDSTFGTDNQNQILHTIFDEFCDRVSLADYVVLAGEAVMALTRPTPSQVQETKARFRSTFRFGRTTEYQCPYNEGRLPNPEEGCPGLA